MIVERYNADQARLWDEFIDNSKNGFFMFRRGYMDYHQDRFQDHSLLFYDEDKLVAVMPANEKDGVLYSHQGLTFGGIISNRRMRGPVMLDVMEGLKSYAKEKGFTKIIYKAIPFFYHKQPAQEDIYALFRHSAVLYRVDLSSTIDMRNKYPFSSSRKSGLKKARDNAIQVEESDDMVTFVDLINGVLNENYQTSATHTADELSLLKSRFPANIRLHVVRHDGQMVAGILTYETEEVMHTQYIAANDVGKDIGALDLILDHLINKLSLSKKYFDFGISTEQGGLYLNENLISQKEGTGARATVHQFFELNI